MSTDLDVTYKLYRKLKEELLTEGVEVDFHFIKESGGSAISISTKTENIIMNRYSGFINTIFLGRYGLGVYNALNGVKKEELTYFRTYNGLLEYIKERVNND